MIYQPYQWVQFADEHKPLKKPVEWLKEQAERLEAEIHTSSERCKVEREQAKTEEEQKRALKNHQQYLRNVFAVNRANIENIKKAIWTVEYMDGLIDKQYTYYRTLDDFKRQYLTIKATAPKAETAAFLRDAEIKYRNYWSYAVQFVRPVSNKIKALDECIEEIVKYIQAELDEVGKPSTDNPEKPEALKIALNKYGFFNLQKIKAISPAKAEFLINKMAVEGNPYTIAMFDYLGFNEHLYINHCESTQYRVSEKLAEILGCHKDTAAGHVSALSPRATKNKRDKNSSWKHKEQVIKDYEALK